jgi:hypothetical protein
MFLRMYFSASSMRERMSPWKSCWSMRVAVVEVAKTAQRSVRAGGLAKKIRAAFSGWPSTMRPRLSRAA